MDCRHRIVARRLAASNTRFDVRFDRIEGPDGVVPEFLMVRPKVLHADLVSGVCVLPEVDGRIGLMRIRRPHFPEPIWVAPSGFVEPGEPTAVSALRELEEETGLTCAPDDLRPLGLLLLDPAVLEARVALFAAVRTRPLPGAAGGAVGELGVGRLELFTPDELEELAVASPDMDGGTVAACLRYLALHRRP
ncbi:NUDIX domain-containing protein [Azospirillum sp. TSO22-1]|uniref:NUDIX domain-containing protein n=1 Tax=Azospirillum sp. TSO22-1 TaxID=716789 RepID=UPI000D649D0B|nr:NUDIX domain-containing protein [Azospirillum sp. TSO22-1]